MLPRKDWLAHRNRCEEYVMDEVVAYTRISKRITALMIDGVFLSIVFLITIFIAKRLGIDSPYHESILILSIVFSVEPFFVSITGASFGHHLSGMRVRRSLVDKKLNLALSYLRFLTKLLLGFLSLISILTTKKHQSIHDLISHSIVVHKNRHSVRSYEVLSERVEETDKYIYPSVFRRIFVICCYLLLLFVLIVFGVNVLLSAACFGGGSCSSLDAVIEWLFSTIFWVVFFVVIWSGWQGRLMGCKRKERHS